MNSIDKLITELHTQLIEKEQTINEVKNCMEKYKFVKIDDYIKIIEFYKELQTILGDKE